MSSSSFKPLSALYIRFSRNSHWEAENPLTFIPRTCLLCLQKLTSDQFKSHLPCKHRYCKDCIARYITTQTQSQSTFIKCPHDRCVEFFPDKIIKRYLTRNEFERFDDIRLRKILVKADASIVICPNQQCTKYMQKRSGESPFLKCVCGEEVCYDCRDKWHVGETCEENMEKDFTNLAKMRDVKKCSMCQSRGEKIDGCEHITCPMCTYEYCWICLEQFSKGHRCVDDDYDYDW